MSRSKFLTAALVAAVALFAAPAKSEAAFKLALDFGFNGVDTVVEDNGAGDLDPTVGSLVYSQGGGGFSVVVSVGTSKPVQPNGVIDLTSIAVSGGAGTLAIYLTDTDFTPAIPGSTYVLSVGGTTTEDPTTLLFAAGGTANNNEFDGTIQTGNIPGVAGPANTFTAVGSFVAGAADPYSLTVAALITHNSAGDSTSFDAELHPTPAPAGLVMLATALPFAGLIRRRLRKSEVATVA